jgi:hypothetical protein
MMDGLVCALNKLSNHSLDLSHQEAALPTIRETVELRRKLANHRGYW